MQRRICRANSALNSVHGSTLFNRLFSKANGKVNFKSAGRAEGKRMSVVPVSSVFALQTRRYKMYRDVYFVPCLRLIFVHASYLLRLFAKALEGQNGNGCPFADEVFTRLALKQL